MIDFLLDILTDVLIIIGYVLVSLILIVWMALLPVWVLAYWVYKAIMKGGTNER